MVFSGRVTIVFPYSLTSSTNFDLIILSDLKVIGENIRSYFITSSKVSANILGICEAEKFNILTIVGVLGTIQSIPAYPLQIYEW